MVYTCASKGKLFTLSMNVAPLAEAGSVVGDCESLEEEYGRVYVVILHLPRS